MRTAFLAPLASVGGYVAGMAATSIRSHRPHQPRTARCRAARWRCGPWPAPDFAAAARYGEHLRAAAERDGDDISGVVEAAYVLGASRRSGRPTFRRGARRELSSRWRYRPEHHWPTCCAPARIRWCCACPGWAPRCSSSAVRMRHATPGTALEWADEIAHPHNRGAARRSPRCWPWTRATSPICAPTAALTATRPDALGCSRGLVDAALRGHIAVDGDPAAGIAAVRP